MMSIVTVDIGGTNIKSAIYTEKGILIGGRTFPTCAQKGGSYVVERVIALIHEYIEVYGGIHAIGISSAGQIDTMGKVIYANDNIPNYTGMPVKQILEEKFRIPIVVENDVNAAAIGEGVFGAAQGKQNYICLTYGTGVGGAIVIDGKLYRGRHGGAGEFGHLILYPGGRSCACGLKGCYEQYASAKALLSLSASFGVETGFDVIELLRKGSHKQELVVRQWCDWLTDGLVTLQHIFDTECIILGGGIMESAEIFPYIKEMLRSKLMPVFQDVEIKRAKLGNKAGMLGVAYQAKKLLEQ